MRHTEESHDLRPVIPPGVEQERSGGKAPVPLYNLTRGIPGHPKHSTVSGATLRAAGFTPPPKKNPRRKRRRKNCPCPSENKQNPPRAHAAGGRKRKLIYSSFTVRHGTTGRGLHVTGGRYYHKSGRRKVAIYGLPGGALELKPHEGRLWGY